MSGQFISDTEVAQITENARRRGEAATNRIADSVSANELERATMHAFAALTRHGYKLIDIRVRKDGREHAFQADWLARMFRGQP